MNRIEKSGTSTAYTIEGIGPPLLLLHGSQATQSMFDELTPILSAHCTVIRYDQRDCGDTTNAAAKYRLGDLAADAYDLVTALGFQKVHVFGTSFGGRIAQTMALLRPQVIDRLILSSTWPLPSSLAELNPIVIRKLRELSARLPESIDELAGMFFPPEILFARPHLKSIFQTVRRSADATARRSEVIADCYDIPLTGIQADTLLLAGDRDQLVPAKITLGMADDIPRCSTLLLNGVGHTAAVQDPAKLARHIVDFIAPSSQPK